MIIALLALATAVPQGLDSPDLAKKITFSAVAAPTKQIFESLSSTSGIKLIPSPAIATDTLAVQVTDTPLKDLMDKIATTIHGQWSNDKDGYRLTRTPGSDELEKKQEIAVSAEAYRRAIQSRVKDAGDLATFDAATAKALVSRISTILAKPGDDVSSWRTLRTLNETSPCGRFLTNLLTLIDPTVIASTPEEFRVVFSNRPTQMQRPLPASVRPAVQQFVREQSIWAAAIKDVKQVEEGISFDGFNYRQTVSGEPKVLLAITKQPFATSTRVELIIADAKGVVIGRAEASLEAGFDEFQKEGTKDSQDNKDKIELSSRSSKFKKLFAFFGAGEPPAFTPLDPELMQVMTNPETIDPLSLTTTEALFGVAKARKVNFVGNIPDVLFALNFPLGSPDNALSVGSVLAMCKVLQTDIVFTPGWMTLMPKYPAMNRAQRIDRSSLGVLMRSGQKNGRISLDEMGKYAVACPTAGIDLLGSTMVMIFDPTMTGLMDNNKLNLYRFYGAMTPGQRAALDAEKPASFKFDTLSPKQIEAVNRMVYGPEPNFTTWGDHPLPVEEEASIRDTIEWEATEVMPQGLSKDGYYTYTLSSSDVLIAPVAEGRRDMTAESLGYVLYQQEHPEKFPNDRREPMNLDKVRLARRTDIELDFMFSPKLALTRQLKDISKRGAETTFAQLPEDFRKRVQRGKELAEQSWKDYAPGQPTKSPPPPPLNR